MTPAEFVVHWRAEKDASLLSQFMDASLPSGYSAIYPRMDNEYELHLL
jgi:hypothetical protein